MPAGHTGAGVRATAVAAVIAFGWMVAFPAAAEVPQTIGGSVKPNVNLPPLKLSEEQRARIKNIVGSKDTDVSFALKSAKPSQSFEPGVGAKIPKGLKLQAFPQPLTQEMPLLKRYSYIKFKDEVLIVNPMNKKIVDIVPLSQT